MSARLVLSSAAIGDILDPASYPPSLRVDLEALADSGAAVGGVALCRLGGATICRWVVVPAPRQAVCPACSGYGRLPSGEVDWQDGSDRGTHCDDCDGRGVVEAGDDDDGGDL